jgi:hypothetical protein
MASDKDMGDALDTADRRVVRQPLNPNRVIQSMYMSAYFVIRDDEKRSAMIVSPAPFWTSLMTNVMRESFPNGEHKRVTIGELEDPCFRGKTPTDIFILYRQADMGKLFMERVYPLMTDNKCKYIHLHGIDDDHTRELRLTPVQFADHCRGMERR